MEIYHQPNPNCVGESLFVCFLRKHFPQANYHPESYPIAQEYLDNSVNTQLLIEALNQNNLLPDQAKQNCLNTLDLCPANLKVALNANRISVDVVITSEENVYYWEFHENQHRNLTVNRDSKIYNAENNAEISVPRYVQRLVRDVWRVQNFEPYTIIWQDWFIANCYTYQPELQPGFQERYLAGNFSFAGFL